jgi:ATP-dependent Lon protease
LKPRHDAMIVVRMSPPKSASAKGAPNGSIVVAARVYPQTLPILPLPMRPAFPKTVAPLLISHPAQIKMLEELLEVPQPLIGLVLEKRTSDRGSSPTSREAPQPVESEPLPPERLHKVGVIAQVIKAQRQGPEGPFQILCGGLDRFSVGRVMMRDPHLVVAVNYEYEPKVEVDGELRAYALAAINSVKELIALNPLFKQELNLLVQQGSIEEPGRLADFAAYLTSAKGEELQRVLECFDVRERLTMVLELLRREIDINELQSDIRARIEERISKQQREFFLREQLKAIKKELGLEKDDKEEEVERFLGRLEGKTLTEEAQGRIDAEVEKFRILEPASPEYNVTRNYLDWLTALPWGLTTEAEISLPESREILEDSHYGLDDVKERILEHIAAGILKGSFSGSIILLVGPPGVGKTSIGRSIAAALKRNFYRFSLGGMRDEAEIKGHRRTYIGAMPGKFVQALRTCGCSDPVIMLDEIDKVGASFRGDPASALLEALDPEQNKDFLDHYLDVRFDLSNVLFVCTANQLDTIPAPLLDRMEMIKLSGYLLEEKLQIAKRYLVPRQLKAHGLKQRQFKITMAALRGLLDGYARDPGVRTADKLVKKVVRKSAVKILEGEATAIKVDKDDLEPLLGRRSYRTSSPYDEPRPGVIMGLAWTSHGGDTLYIEATSVRSERGGLKQTGQLGKVMVESSEIAYTTARRLFAADSEDGRTFFDDHFVHMHVPAGATPKDGPSAGITIAAALYTLAVGEPIKKGWAMTGELNLSGHVMPVGGIKEKVIAARRAHVKHVIMPADNEGDWERLPDYLKRRLSAHFVAHFDDVIRLCLPKGPKKR